MNHIKKVLVCILGIGFIVCFYYLLKPVEVSEKNTRAISSILWRVSEGGLGDYVMELEGKSGLYYIAKSQTQGLPIDSLKLLEGQPVSISFLKPKALSQVGPMISKRQVVRLAVADKVVFSAI